MRLKNKVAIITGGSRGIGFATAQAFLKEGATVIITASSKASSDRAVEELRQQFPQATVGGVYPDADNIRNGTYPITANFYVVYRKDNDNPNVKKLADWLLSEEGQRLIEACGYVGL